MLAGGRRGAGEPSSPSPVGWAQRRGRNLAGLLCPLLWTSGCSGRLGVPPHPCLHGAGLGGKWGSAGGRPSGSQGLPLSTHGARSSRLGPGDSRARATFWT